MEHQVEQRDVVIKVKYGDTLRRIGAYVHGHTMDHNMSRLRAKIVGLFKFNHEAELLLTYIDEDGDTVTLDDDDELRDAVISQRLNPLRINVQFKSADSSEARSETSSRAKAPQSETPPTLDEHVKSIQDPLLGLISNLVSIVQKSVPSSPAYSSDPKSDKSSHAKAPQNGTHPIVDGEPKSIQDPFMDVIHNLVNNVQKSVPSSQAYIQKVDELMKSEPIRSVMANVAQDLKKTTSLSPVLDQIMEQVSNLALSKAGETSGPTDESSIGPGGASTHQMASSEQIQETTELPSNGASSVCAAPKQNTSCDMTQVAGDTIISVGPSGNIRRDTTSSLYPFDDLLASILTANKSSEHDQEVGDSILNGKSAAPTAQGFQPGNQTPVDLENLWNSARYCPVYVNVPADTMVRDNSKMQSPVEAHASFPSQTGFSSHIEVPVSRETGSPPTDVFPKLGQGMVSHSYRRSYANNENIPRTFHRGVQCDGCGMHPIVGPRFKSNVKDDYDLCNICFAQMGNETEYTRIDHASRRAPRLLKPGILKDFHNHHSKCRFPSVNVLRASGARPSRAKLESRFVQDVTVLDGTVMPPSTRFTKIWRLHNNGTLAWPLGTQLVWVGGDQFGDRVSSTLEIPANGFPVDKELDIAVDFTAPSRPGRYVSYWRMASLSGQQFGQRVWVLIQVDYSRPNSAAGSNVQPAFNLNLPPDSSSQNLIIDVNAEPLDSGLPEPSVTTTTEEPVKPVAESVTVGEPVQVVGGLLDAGNVEHHQPTPAAAVPPVASYPLINLQEMLPMVDEFPVTESAATADSNPVEQTLLKELEDMGFKEINLNKEILRLNEYNLEQSVDDLCGFAEWDPLLCELHEMGFNNREMNKKALIKNGGSIKRAVLDLIAGQISE